MQVRMVGVSRPLMPAGLWLTAWQWRSNRQRLVRNGRWRHHGAGRTTQAHDESTRPRPWPYFHWIKGPVADVYIDQHNGTLLSSQNWLARLVNPTRADYNAMYRSVVDTYKPELLG